MDLKPIRGHATMHGDAHNIFLLGCSCDFSLILEKNNQEEERFESIKSNLLPSSLRPTLASTELAFNSVSLEVLESCLCVDTFREEPKTWFVFCQATNIFQEQIFKGI